MRLAYLAYEWFDEEAGALKKIAGQLRAWTAAGHEARFFLLSSSPRPQRLAPLQGCDVQVQHGANSWNAHRTGRQFAQSLADWRPDLIYVRCTRFFPAMSWLARRCPTVGEINSDIARELRQQRRPLYGFYQRMLCRPFLRRTAGLVCVTHELARRYAWCGKLSLVCGNGIDLTALTPYPPPANAAPRVVMIASPGGQPKGGVDKVLRLAAQFSEWRFDVVGMTAAQFAAPLPANVLAHGPMSAEAYGPLLAAADAALGPLALHRAGMNESSSLKVREYLACGVPTILAGRDTDFPDASPALLSIPNTETNVEDSATDVRRFVESWRGRRVARADIAHLDNAVKEHARLELFTTLTQSRAS